MVDNMRLMLRDCPQTAKVKWRDFGFFLKNWKRTLTNATAWKRGQDAIRREKAQMSKHGACVLCEINPAASAAGAYSAAHCTTCHKQYTRASQLLDKCEGKFVWHYSRQKDSPKWIGTQGSDPNNCLYSWDYGTTHDDQVRGLMNQPHVMDAVGRLLAGVPVAAGFEPEEAE